MLRSFSLLTLAAVSLAACVETTQQLGSDGKPLPQLYRIRAGETSAIQFRMANLWKNLCAYQLLFVARRTRVDVPVVLPSPETAKSGSAKSADEVVPGAVGSGAAGS